MPRISISERMRALAMAAEKSRRSAVSRTLNSPLLRWRYSSSGADQLLILPQCLRTADPSFWHEVAGDQFGLAGQSVALGGHSPFDVEPPSEGWARELNGFSWLRHLGAAEDEDADKIARDLALDWVSRQRGMKGVAWQPHVLSRRLISWITHAGLLLDPEDEKTYDAIVGSLSAQLVHLAATWRDAPPGEPRLLSLIALVLADLSIAGHDRQLADAERHFTAELDKQILSDGGHISRNPHALVELLLDLLPLRKCFLACERALPPGFDETVERMLAMLRYMRLGDGMPSRFNGMAVPSPADIATVIAYCDKARPPSNLLMVDSGYARLERAGTIVVVDAGPPPPLELAGQAHAGCLAFEFSSGRHPILVNAGAPGPSDQDWRAVSRATASHNTMCLGGKSSSKLVHHKRLEDLIGALPIRYPDKVRAHADVEQGQLILRAHHDGYGHRFGLVHARTLKLSPDGARLSGVDQVRGTSGPMRKAKDIPFAIHFHLYPGVMARINDAPNCADLILPGGETWQLKADGAQASLEEATYFPGTAGPRETIQIVLRGATYGECEIGWVIERVG